MVSTIADKVGGHRADPPPPPRTVLNLPPRPGGAVRRDPAPAQGRVGRPACAGAEVPYDDSLAAIRRTTSRLGDALGARDKAAALLAHMDGELARARRTAPRPSVRTLIYEPNGYATSGPVTEELMAIAGLADAAPGYAPTRSGRIPVEAVIAAAPDLLIYSGQRDVAGRAGRSGAAPSRAGGAGRAYLCGVESAGARCSAPGRGRRTRRRSSRRWGARRARLRGGPTAPKTDPTQRTRERGRSRGCPRNCERRIRASFVPLGNREGGCAGREPGDLTGACRPTGAGVGARHAKTASGDPRRSAAAWTDRFWR